MVAPPVGQDQDEAAVKSTKPGLPRAIQMVMTILSLLEPSTTASTETIEEHGVWHFFAWMKLEMVMTISSLLEPSTTASTETIGEHGVWRFFAWMKLEMVMTISSLLEPSTTASTETIGEHGVWRFFTWMKLVFLPSMFIAVAVLSYYAHDDDDDEVISGGGGGFVFLAVLFLPHVYFAVVLAAGGYLDLFAPQTPYAAWVALYKVGFESMGGAVILTSFVALVLYMLMLCKAWLLLVTCAYLLGLLVAFTIAFWLCLLRTYGGGDRREKNSSSRSEVVIDGLAYIYTRLLYEYAVRFLVDADAGVQQLDTDIVIAVV